MTESEFESAYKINSVFDKCLEFIRAIHNLNEDEKRRLAQIVKKWQEEESDNERRIDKEVGSVGII